MQKLFLHLVLFAICGLMAPTGCSGQEKEGTVQENQEKKPDIKISVNREYDEAGNLVRFDSTYTWSYTSKSGDSIALHPDSVMKEFQQFFHQNRPSWIDSHMHPWFHLGPGHPDEFLMPEFYHDRWQQDFYDMKRMFRQMDSIKMEFFDQRYPGFQEKGTKGENMGTVDV